MKEKSRNISRRSFLQKTVAATAGGTVFSQIVPWKGFPAAASAGPAAAGKAHSLQRAFNNPPLDARVRCFWWWLNGNVTKEAITRDLEEMKAKHFGGAMIFDAGGASHRGNHPVPAGPAFGTPSWRELFSHAVREAGRLGLELSLNIQSGWNLGGPAVKPEESAQQLVWSETQVQGPGPFQGQLEVPRKRFGFYRDVAAVAIPVHGKTAATPQLKASSSQARYPPERAVDGNKKTFWVSGEAPAVERPAWLQFSCEEPVTVSGLYLLGRSGYGPRKCKIQTSSDGRKYRDIKSFGIQKGKATTIRFDPVQLSHLRLIMTDAYDPRSPGRPRNVQVAEIALLDAHGNAMGGIKHRPIRNLREKAAFRELGGSAPDCRPLLFGLEPVEGEEDAKLPEVKVLTNAVRPDGSLAWNVPEGEWRIFRFGHTATGAHVSTSSAGWRGLVLDYMNKKTLRSYWKRNVEPILAAVEPHAGDTLRYLHTDSWECGGMNWTAGFAKEFENRRGYDPLPWLPVIAGCIIENRRSSNAFLADFRKTIADLVARHYGLFAELAHARGMGIHPESAGPHAGPMDGLQNYGRSDLMMSEFWSPSPHRPRPADRFFVKQAASAAHTYGKRLVGAEAFTTIGPHWNDVPWATMKPAFDHEVCDGLNLAFFHTFTCSPEKMGVPGQEYFAGTHFNPNITWWDWADTFVSYLNRCQAVAQQGRFIADVLYYYGDHVPNIARRKADDPAGALPGFDYDVINEELLASLSVHEGKLTLPSGMAYRLLVLPGHKVLSLKALRTAKRLVSEGAALLGPKPLRAVSLAGGAEGAAEFQRRAAELWGAGEPAEKGSRRVGSGRVQWGITAREALLAEGVRPDCEFKKASQGAVLGWIHYRTDEAELYFICNQRPQKEQFICRVRVSGMQPELWDPVTGTKRDASTFKFQHGLTSLPLQLGPYGSLLIAFRRKASSGGGKVPNTLELVPVQKIRGPWNVHFDTKWGGPGSARFQELTSWTKRPEPGIKYYSGSAVYRLIFDLDRAARNASQLFLDLGKVKDAGIAQVRLNGVDLGTVWCPPFRLNITGAVRTERNELQITVVNSWRNRLVGDRSLPNGKRFTETNVRIRKSWKLLQSGLLGPVNILRG